MTAVIPERRHVLDRLIEAVGHDALVQVTEVPGLLVEGQGEGLHEPQAEGV